MHPGEELRATCRALIVSVALSLAAAMPAYADTASYATDDVTRVRYALPGVLIVRAGEQERLEVDAEPTVLQQLDVRTNGEQLLIASKGSFRTDKGLRLTLTLKSLRSLAADGSGDTRIEGFGGGALEAIAAGSGRIRLAEVKPSRLTLAIKGSGGIEAAGSGDRLQALIDGSGEIDAAGFRAQSVQARLRGSGTIRVHADQDLQAVISGAGNIEYKGNARVTQSITGAGRVNRR